MTNRSFVVTLILLPSLLSSPPLELEAHQTPIGQLYFRYLIDSSSIRKIPNERLGNRLSHHTGTQGFEFNCLVIFPMPFVIVHFSHRGYTHVVDSFAFGIECQQT